MGQMFTFQGKQYDSDEYRVVYDGGEQRLVEKNSEQDKDFNSSKIDTSHRTPDDVEDSEGWKKSVNAERWNKFKQGAGNTLQGASRAAAYAGAATAKAQGINDPQAGHYAQQAALSEAQAAKMRADEQLARQEAYRNSGDRALTESAKMAEASSAANIRNNQKAMSAEMGGAAATMSAQKNANVDPMQNAMAHKQQGYNRQDTATQLGQQAATYQSGAEAQRANATESGELTKQNAVDNAEKKRAAQAQAEQNAEEWELYRRKTESEIAKNEGEAAQTQAAAENTTQQTQEAQTKAAEAAPDSMQAYANSIDDMIKRGVKVGYESNLGDYWAAMFARDSGARQSSYQKLQAIVDYLGGKDSTRALSLKNTIENSLKKNGIADTSPYMDYINSIVSDERMKNILSPAGRTLLHLYKGRTR